MRRCMIAVTGIALLGSATLVATAPTVFAERRAAVASSEPATAPNAPPADTGAADAITDAKAAPVKWVPAVNPKPLSEQVKKGLAWLVEHQNEDGGWGQGEESSHMGRDQANLKDKSNVADTAMAAMALIRAGSTPAKGDHAANIVAAIDFICGQIEAADDKSLYVTDIRGTRVQGKIGTYVDTFLAANLLAEVKDRMPDAAGNQRVFAALDKVLDKIEKNQKDDGGWDNQGWAGGLGGAMGQKALARAKQVGMDVDEAALDKAQEGAQAAAAPTSDGRFRDDGRSAGIELYSAASSVGGLADSSKANVVRRQEAQREAEQAQAENAALAEALPAATEPERKRIEAQVRENNDRIKANEAKIAEYDKADQDLEQAKAALIVRMEDKGFVAGFGNNGGEEFLSYLQIGEALVVDGGEAFKDWDQKMTKNLNNVQNDDGSWSGHHCITGRTFCTSAALMVLTIDRAPAPVHNAVRGG